jgi:hypothetical protein
MRQLTLVIAVTGCLAAFGVAGCGSSSSSSSAAGTSTTTSTATSTTSGKTHLATAKFLFHAGLASGAFRQIIYKPFNAGDLKHPFEHKLTLIKAGLVAVFVYHELKLAAQDARPRTADLWRLTA